MHDIMLNRTIQGGKKVSVFWGGGGCDQTCSVDSHELYVLPHMYMWCRQSRPLRTKRLQEYVLWIGTLMTRFEAGIYNTALLKELLR